MRIAIGEFAHETNTFRPGLTTVADFKARQWFDGDEILVRLRGVRQSLGGMIAAADRLGIEVVPTLAASAEPSATIARATYETIRDLLFDRIRAAGPLDAICLALHGAGVVEGIDDLEGTLLGELRIVVGSEIPIVVTLDLHGHVTPAMVEHATALLNCHLYPHTDDYERGEEAIELAAKVVRGEVKPTMHLEVLPMIIPPSTTMVGPAAEVNQRCFAYEREPGVLDCAFVHGFPHTDIPGVYSSVLVTTDGDPALAERIAKELGRYIWEHRDDFLAELPGAEEAVRQALAVENGPVVIAEISDNPGGGAPGDGTHLLRALLAANEPLTCFGFITDPETARQAVVAGPGATIRVCLGAKSDDLHGQPIEADAYVKSVTDGRFIYTTPMGAGSEARLGPMARLVIGNVDVIVATGRTQTLDSEVFLLHGIDVTRYRVVALKSQQHFRAGFAHLAAEIIRCDTPGSTTSNLSLLPFRRINRPIWPLDRT